MHTNYHHRIIWRLLKLITTIIRSDSKTNTQRKHGLKSEVIINTAFKQSLPIHGPARCSFNMWKILNHNNTPLGTGQWTLGNSATSKSPSPGTTFVGVNTCGLSLCWQSTAVMFNSKININGIELSNCDKSRLLIL